MKQTVRYCLDIEDKWLVAQQQKLVFFSATIVNVQLRLHGYSDQTT